MGRRKWEADLEISVISKDKYSLSINYPYYYEMDELTGTSELLMDHQYCILRGNRQRIYNEFENLLKTLQLPCKLRQSGTRALQQEISNEFHTLCWRHNKNFKNPESYLVVNENFQRLREEI